MQISEDCLPCSETPNIKGKISPISSIIMIKKDYKMKSQSVTLLQKNHLLTLNMQKWSNVPYSTHWQAYFPKDML